MIALRPPVLLFQRWRSPCYCWPTLLWRHPVVTRRPAPVTLRPAARWWRGACSPCKYSSSSSWAKQMTYRTVSSVGRVPASHEALIALGHFYYFLISHVCLCRQGHLEREALASAVPEFIYTCQPFFNHLESMARCTVSQLTLPFDMYTQVEYMYIVSHHCCVAVLMFWVIWSNLEMTSALLSSEKRLN